jgi:hypothetical protein
MALNMPKSGRAFVTTIKVMVSAEACQNSVAGDCDYFSTMLSENADVDDWGHTRSSDGKAKREPYSIPYEVTVPKGYAEGDMFLRKRAPKKVKRT